MSRGHVSSRRRSFSPRAHHIRENVDTTRLTYKAAGATSDEAIEDAKRQARDEGWTIRTVASCRPSDDGGMWLVGLAACHS